MRVLAIDGGILNVGVCVLQGDSVELIHTDQIHSTSKISPADLAFSTAEWVCERAEAWGLENVELVIVESVVRAKINAVGLNIISSIRTWCICRGKDPPRVIMKAGRSKFSINASLKSRALSSKGKINYNNRKLLSVQFCNNCWPGVTEGCGPDACDALLLAIAGVKHLPAGKRRIFETILQRCEEGEI